MKTILCVVSLSMMALLPATAQDAVTESAGDQVLALLRASVTNLPQPVVAVLPFRRSDGSKAIEGELLADRLITLLSMEPDLRVVERRQLDAALAEQKLALDGFVSTETAARAGKLTGARALVTGTITDLGEFIELNARIVDVQSGEVLNAQSIKARRSIKTFINPLWDEIDAIKAKGKKFTARVWTDRDRLRVGDLAAIQFEVDRDCHVTLFDFSTDGSITVLFPNRFQPDNRVRAGRIYRIPPEDGGYKIRVQGPAGIERVKLFATTEDVQLYVRDYAQSPFSTLGDGDVAGMRGLQATSDGLEKSDWAESTWEFLIENVLR